MTPLHDAVLRGDVGLVRVLVKFGADPTVRAIKGKHEGKSALDLAENRSELLIQNN